MHYSKKFFSILWQLCPNSRSMNYSPLWCCISYSFYQRDLGSENIAALCTHHLVSRVHIPKHQRITLKDGTSPPHKLCLPQPAGSRVCANKCPMAESRCWATQGTAAGIILSLPTSTTTKWSGWRVAHSVTFSSKGSRLTPSRTDRFRNSSSFSEGPQNTNLPSPQ